MCPVLIFFNTLYAQTYNIFIYCHRNTYYYDTDTNLLHVRIIQAPLTYTGDILYSSNPKWRLWDLDDLNADTSVSRTHALDRFTFDGITLPRSINYGLYLEILADCNQADSSSLYCPMPQGYSVESHEVCPSGYTQVAYDNCCLSSGSTDCYDFTIPPSTSPTLSPTLDPNGNRLLNPDFENDELSPWNDRGGTIAIIDTSTYYSGTQSVLVTNQAQLWEGMEQFLYVKEGDVVVIDRIEEDATYSLSCFAKIKGDTVTSDQFRVKFQIDYSDGTKNYPGYTKDINNNDWTEVGGNLNLATFITTPGTLQKLKFYTEGPSAGVEYWVDNCSVVLVE